MATSKESLVPVKEMDFLEQDPPLRGQNYVCLSFVSPEDVIKKKEVFFFEEFMKHFSIDMCEWFSNMEIKFPSESQTLKALKESEKALLLTPKSGLLEPYFNHMIRNEKSLLSRFYGVYSIRSGSMQEITCFITDNLLGSDFMNIERIYDLKGSTVGRIVKLTD